MTTPTVVPTGFNNDASDFRNVKCDKSGAVRQVAGTVTVPDATAAGAFVGLVPFNKGARFVINDKSVHITDIDAGTDSLVNLGIIYADSGEGTDDVDAFVSQSTAGQAGGFLTVDETAGMTLVTTGNGWLAVENDVNATEAEGTITFNVGVVYDQPTQ
jgi:hypothetical protein